MDSKQLIVLSADPQLVRWVGATVGAVGWKYIAAKDKDDALACLRQAEVHGIILVGEEPNEGVNLCAALQREAPSIPIVALTERPVVDDALCLRIAGAQAVLDRGAFHARTLDAVLLAPYAEGFLEDEECGFLPEILRAPLDRLIAARTPPAALVDLVGSMAFQAGGSESGLSDSEDPKLEEMANTFIRRCIASSAAPDVEMVEDLLARVTSPQLRESLLPPLLFACLSPWTRAAELLGLPTHAAACAAAAKALAPFARGADPARAFIAGLLHDVGISLILRALPGAYERVVALARRADLDLHSAEGRILGPFSHEEEAARAFEAWGLPAEFAEAARAEHPAKSSPPTGLGRLHAAASAVAGGLDLSLRLQEAPAEGSGVRRAADLLEIDEEVVGRATAGLREEAIRCGGLLVRERRADYASQA